MRADRLVATLLLLQARGTVTAAEVATELEVSSRTARRDLDALSMAGIPVFSKQGRGGGWELIGGARTDLTGLRSAEARALLTMAAAAGPSTAEFSGAIRKLVQALPEPQRVEAERAMAAIVSDDTAWGNLGTSTLVEPRRDDHLEPLQRAILGRQRIEMVYDTPRSGPSQRSAEPLGLVTKQGFWYVLAMTDKGQRTFRVDRIVRVDVLDVQFDHPEGFDLAAAWESITTGYVERSTRIATNAIIDVDIIPALRALGVETELGDIIGDGRQRAVIGSWSAAVLAASIAGVAHAIELVDPPAGVEQRLGEIGRSLAERFG